MKEQNKTPEKELNEMEISNLSDAQFKTLGYQDAPGTHWVLQYHKKDPGRNKGCISEIKKNLHGTNSGWDETKNQINDLEYRKEKAFH